MWRYEKSWTENVFALSTPLLLSVLAVTSLLLRYVSDKIQCSYVYPQANEYFGEFCFHETSVQMRTEEFVEFTQQSLGRDPQSKPFEEWPTQHTYHQWVPFALGIAAILCLLPHVTWRMLSGLLWLDPHALVQTLTDNQRHNPATRHMMLKDSALVLQSGLKGGKWMLSMAMMLRKGVTCVVCVVQMVWIVVVFKPPLGARGEEKTSNFTGVNVTVPDSLDDVPLPVDPFFCTLSISQRRNAQTMIIQCLLPNNKVFVQGFIFLFYFFLLLLVLCITDLFYWATRVFLPRVRDVSLRRHLSVIDQSEKGNGGSSSLYICDFLAGLGADGHLVMAVVADACAPAQAVDFTRYVWSVFKQAGEGVHGEVFEVRAAQPDHPWQGIVSGGDTCDVTDDDGVGIPLQAVGEAVPGEDDKTKLC